MTRARNHCRSCGAPMVWVLTRSGGHMPLDPEPSPRGNIVLELGPNDQTVSRVLRADEEPASGQLRWLSHFATCPNAKEHRRQK